MQTLAKSNSKSDRQADMMQKLWINHIVIALPYDQGVWTWMSGAPWSYEHWGEGEPNQVGQNNHVISGGLE